MSYIKTFKRAIKVLKQQMSFFSPFITLPKRTKSIPQKVVIHILELFFLWLSFWILFKNGGQWAETHLHIHNAVTDYGRRTIILFFNVVIFFRLAYMIFFLLKRKIPWKESIGVPVAFAIYYVGYSLFVLPTSVRFNLGDVLAIALFVIRCLLNSGGEILRKKWKDNPDHRVSHRPTAYCLEAFYDRLILRKVFIRLSGAAEDPGFC
jgi:hypothetical protein